MNFFDQVFSKIFKSASESNPVSVDSLIRRSEAFSLEYTDWKTSNRHEELLNDINKSYSLAKNGLNEEPTIVLLEGSYSNGLAISYHNQYEKSSFHFFFDFLAEKVKELGYKMSVSKQTLKEMDTYVEKKEMHYLKPKRDFSKPIDQKYGNIQIEYIEVDYEPARIKLIVNSYPDGNYTRPLSFDDLTEFIFKH